MPFTFCHPAAILPLRTTALVFPALVVGACSPDFSYFFRWFPSAGGAHYLNGFLNFCVPVSLVILVIWQHIVARPVSRCLWGVHKRALLRFADKLCFTTRQIPLILASIAIGGGSHLLWDSFTHKTGHFVSLYSLDQTVFSIYGVNVTLFKLLQHLSSLIGGACLLSAYIRWTQVEETTTYPKSSIDPEPVDIESSEDLLAGGPHLPSLVGMLLLQVAAFSYTLFYIYSRFSDSIALYQFLPLAFPLVSRAIEHSFYGILIFGVLSYLRVFGSKD